MTTITVGPDESEVGTGEPGWDDAWPAEDGPGPPAAFRAAVVAAFWAGPGILAGLLLAAFLPGVCDPYPAGTAGGVLFGAAGAWLEAFD